MMLDAVLQEELDRIDTLTIIEAVAYANQLNSRLRRNDCSDEERKNGFQLLERLSERLHFLKITLEPVFSRTG